MLLPFPVFLFFLLLPSLSPFLPSRLACFSNLDIDTFGAVLHLKDKALELEREAPSSRWFPVALAQKQPARLLPRPQALEEEGGFGGQVELSSSVAGGGGGLVDAEDPRAAGWECFL